MSGGGSRRQAEPLLWQMLPALLHCSYVHAFTMTVVVHCMFRSQQGILWTFWRTGFARCRCSAHMPAVTASRTLHPPKSLHPHTPPLQGVPQRICQAEGRARQLLGRGHAGHEGCGGAGAAAARGPRLCGGLGPAAGDTGAVRDPPPSAPQRTSLACCPLLEGAACSGGSWRGGCACRCLPVSAYVDAPWAR